ncbi:MAG: hypothetical protein M3065_09815 [Actinomycetota bacterium]|nr:hypothetical protein [Actinomycetota bacterium]
MPFADIANARDRSEAAAPQLASRERRHVRAAPEPDPDLARQREVVDAFFAASRDGDFARSSRSSVPTSSSGLMAGYCARKTHSFCAGQR